MTLLRKRPEAGRWMVEARLEVDGAERWKRRSEARHFEVRALALGVSTEMRDGGALGLAACTEREICFRFRAGKGKDGK